MHKNLEASPYSSQKRLNDVQHQLKNSEYDRKAYAEETLANVKKQKITITTLQSENEALKESLAKLSSVQATPSKHLGVIDENYDGMRVEYEEAIQIEKEKLDDYAMQFDELQLSIKNQKKAAGGVNAVTESQVGIQKQVKTLENRLDQANQKFNESIAANKTLRVQIDGLRRERVIFDNLYKKLEKELHEKRKNMASIIESANTAYEERDKASEQIENLKQQAKRETNDFERELKELSQTMVKSHKALEYIQIAKAQELSNQKAGEKEAEEFKRKLNSMKNEKDRVNAVNEKIQKYEEDLAKMQAATGITDFEKLVETFVKNEEKNFGAFRFVNDLSNEIEELEKTITELKEEKMKYEVQPVKKDVEKMKNMKNLEDNLMRVEGRLEHYEYKTHEATKIINSICNWTESVYNSLDCERINEDTLGTHGVTETNLMSYFSIIEERATQIIAAYVRMKQSENNFRPSFDYMPNNNSALKLKQEVPSFDEFSDDDADGDKPFTMEEFMMKAMTKIDNNTKTVPTKGKPGQGKDKRR